MWYITTKKIYLETHYSDLKRKMENSDKNIIVHKSGVLFGHTIVLQKSMISEYGEAGMI